MLRKAVLYPNMSLRGTCRSSAAEPWHTGMLEYACLPLSLGLHYSSAHQSDHDGIIAFYLTVLD